MGTMTFSSALMFDGLAGSSSSCCGSRIERGKFGRGSSSSITCTRVGVAVSGSEDRLARTTASQETKHAGSSEGKVRDPQLVFYACDALHLSLHLITYITKSVVVSVMNGTWSDTHLPSVVCMSTQRSYVRVCVCVNESILIYQHCSLSFHKQQIGVRLHYITSHH